ncbi:MAG TPA: PEP-CTERM sorting domain-containing protein [Anaerohalosphaeraceae bacterium]|nr:PEP-CTERM sorting domain-containing protein [Anaerohalosphaeraceae bacterium]
MFKAKKPQVCTSSISGYSATLIPEPATLGLLALGGVLLRKRRNHLYKTPNVLIK